MPEFTKSERKKLRALAGIVYEAEARAVLGELDESFKRWRSKDIDSSILLNEIHHFHQYDSRRLWSIYQSLKDDQVVARGLALGFIKEKDVDPGVFAKLAPLINVYRE